MLMGMVSAIPRVVIIGPSRTTLFAQQKSDMTVPIIALAVIYANAFWFGN